MRISVQARCGSRDGPGTTGDGLVAASALPDANGLTLYGVLAAEGADIASVLCNFHLLDLFAERRAVSSTVLAGHADLLGALRHVGGIWRNGVGLMEVSSPC